MKFVCTGSVDSAIIYSHWLYLKKTIQTENGIRRDWEWIFYKVPTKNEMWRNQRENWEGIYGMNWAESGKEFMEETWNVPIPFLVVRPVPFYSTSFLP